MIEQLNSDKVDEIIETNKDAVIICDSSLKPKLRGIGLPALDIETILDGFVDTKYSPNAEYQLYGYDQSLAPYSPDTQVIVLSQYDEGADVEEFYVRLNPVTYYYTEDD